LRRYHLPFISGFGRNCQKIGYTDVRVYHESEPEWSEAKLPTYSTNEFIKNGNVVLIDIRPTKKQSPEE